MRYRWFMLDGKCNHLGVQRQMNNKPDRFSDLPGWVQVAMIFVGFWLIAWWASTTFENRLWTVVALFAVCYAIVLAHDPREK